MRRLSCVQDCITETQRRDGVSFNATALIYGGFIDHS